jgi:hypothetical protein
MPSHPPADQFLTFADAQHRPSSVLQGMPVEVQRGDPEGGVCANRAAGGEAEDKTVTPTERRTLEYLDASMGASSHQIGVHLMGPDRPEWVSTIAVGAGILGHLRREGLVVKVVGLGLWRITVAGREALR